MPHTTVVPVIGRPGRDLAMHGDADEVRLLDVVIRRAQDAAARVNDLVGREVVKAGIADATDKTSASQVLEGMHACLSGVPYFLNVTLAKAADYLDKELPRAIKRLFTVLEALVIVVLGALIAVSALSMLLPIFQIQGQITK